MADNNIIKMACSLLQVQNSFRVKFIDTNNNPTILLQKVLVSQDCCFNPSTPMSDQDRISPYNINTISSRQAMRIKKILIWGLFVDQISNSLNQPFRNCTAVSMGKY